LSSDHGKREDAEYARRDITEEQILVALQQAECGKNVAAVCVCGLILSRRLDPDRSSSDRRAMRLFVEVNNLFDTYQRDLDRGPLRDAGYFYGPMSMRTVTLGMTMTF
jgi:hypothetical protein